jgi:hypothetical protein
MDDVIEEFNKKLNEIDTYLNFVWLLDKIENSTLEIKKVTNATIIDDTDELYREVVGVLNNEGDYDISNDLWRILAANSILLLYNLVEGTITSTMNYYFSTFNNHYNYSELINPLQIAWLKYENSKDVGDNISSKNFHGKYALKDDIIFNIRDARQEEDSRIVSDFEAYTKKDKGAMGGNLDAKKINEICMKFGLPLVKLKCNELLTIKDLRNKLAHGNNTFVEIGKERTIEDLIKMRKAVEEYFTIFLNQTNDFINDKGFLR